MVNQLLILSRRVGESVLIGDDVSITVLRIKGNQVRLGVSAPRTVSVHREIGPDPDKPAPASALGRSSAEHDKP